MVTVDKRKWPVKSNVAFTYFKQIVGQMFNILKCLFSYQECV